MDQGLLCREVCDPKTFDKWKQVIVPQCLQNQVLGWVHDRAGHLGVEKTLGLARRRFFWPGLARGVERWCRQCVRCNLHKTPVNTVNAPLVVIRSEYPLQIVSVDFLSLEPARSGMCNILVMMDHFTRYAVAVPTLDQTAVTTARVLWGPLGGLINCIPIKAPILSQKSSKNYVLCTTSISRIPLPIIQQEMDNVSVLIGHC